ncbi:hypothetical protein ACFYXF_47995 [Streptomyces sp. NPDC002680]|uniref:hypothetical protein n=1 Tax=Streptomyces sp. NPDC002680 TaxID=3364659 RepID=UPI0036CFDEEC
MLGRPSAPGQHRGHGGRVEIPGRHGFRFSFLIATPALAVELILPVSLPRQCPGPRTEAAG